MSKIRKFFKDTWKILLAIFIIVATLLYSLIFDGSEIPFLVAFMSAFVILFLHNVKDLIIYIKQFLYLKKSDFFKYVDKSGNIYNHCLVTIRMQIFFCLLSGGWLAYLILYLTGVITF